MNKEAAFKSLQVLYYVKWRQALVVQWKVVMTLVPDELICFADLPSTALIRALVTWNTIWTQLQTDGMLPDHDECNDCGLAGLG